MNRFQSFFVRFFILYLSFCFPAHAFGQVKKQKNSLFGGKWSFDIRAGNGTFFSGVPENFRERINGVNIPVGVTAPTGVFILRKEISRHFEIGYQFDYTSMHGRVENEENTYKVTTHATTNNFLILYKLKGNSDYSPGVNYLVYYKIGNLSFNNDARQLFPDGTVSTVPEYVPSDKFIRDMTLSTGIGIGVSQQINEHLSLTATFELNRSTYSLRDLYQIQTFFHQSEYTITKSGFLTAGLSYTFHLKKQRNTGFHASGGKKYKKQIQPRRTAIRGIE